MEIIIDPSKLPKGRDNQDIVVESGWCAAQPDTFDYEITVPKPQMVIDDDMEAWRQGFR